MGREGEGEGRGGGAKVWRSDLEKYMGLDQPQVVAPVGGDERLVRPVTAGQKACRGEGRLGGRRPLQKGRGGDSEYHEYNEQPQVCILYGPSFLSVCFTKGWVY